MAAAENQLNTSATGRSGSENENTSQIQEDIDRTRARMDETLDELGDRLNPKQWWESITETVSGTVKPEELSQYAKSTGRSLGKAIINHPVPAACIGLGIAWLIVEQVRSRNTLEMYGGSYVDARTGKPYTTSYGKEFKGKLEQMRQQQDQPREQDLSSTAGSSGHAEASHSGNGRKGILGKMRRSAKDAMGYVREHTPDIGGYAKQGYEATSETIGATVDQYPLAAAGGAFALGLLAGIAMPACSWEDRMYGPYSDQLKQRAKETGRELYEDSGRMVKEQAENLGLTPDAIKDKVCEVSSQVTDVAMGQSGKPQNESQNQPGQQSQSQSQGQGGGCNC
jgi:hypothetical protein